MIYYGVVQQRSGAEPWFRDLGLYEKEQKVQKETEPNKLNFRKTKKSEKTRQSKILAAKLNG
ncbi:hypothetical protein BpHYR1_010143 [Brachionus plicatilis]|uniref:Uncharacterized protein n=1 Tax=Brachionus plicatilis TaxID=10195 RepID=A0A3M7R981_BRAPC|nr:hypothetical protein BpHYR1_010143 [Brachionus plicatilis]